MPFNRINVVGLKELQAALRVADKDFPKALRLANKEGADVVADATRASFASRGGVAPKVVASVKTQAQQRSASVKIGGRKFPYAMGSEFGGGKYGKGNPKPPGGGYTTQFPAFRKTGYSLFPALVDKRDEVIEVYSVAVDRLMAKAFPK